MVEAIAGEVGVRRAWCLEQHQATRMDVLGGEDVLERGQLSNGELPGMVEPVAPDVGSRSRSSSPALNDTLP